MALNPATLQKGGSCQAAKTPSNKSYPVTPNNCSGLLLINSHKESLQNSTFFQFEHWLSHNKNNSKYLNFLQTDLILQSRSSQCKNPQGCTQPPTYCQPNHHHHPAPNTTFLTCQVWLVNHFFAHQKMISPSWKSWLDATSAKKLPIVTFHTTTPPTGTRIYPSAL